ncbi:hypothetical protein KCU98_g167, partial [Aureobasidium melanogenum]
MPRSYRRHWLVLSSTTLQNGHISLKRSIKNGQRYGEIEEVNAEIASGWDQTCSRSLLAVSTEVDSFK